MYACARARAKGLVRASCPCEVFQQCRIGKLFVQANRLPQSMRVIVGACVAFAWCSPLVVGKQERVDIHFESAPDDATAEGLGHLRATGAGFLAGPGLGGGEFDRETQSPMVWLNLHKSASVPASSGQSFGAYAAQQLADSDRQL